VAEGHPRPEGQGAHLQPGGSQAAVRHLGTGGVLSHGPDATAARSAESGHGRPVRALWGPSTIEDVLNSFSRRVAVSALAVVIGLGLVGCGDDIPTSEPPPDQGSTVGSDTSSAPSTSVPSTSATSESPGGEEPSSAPSTSSEPAPSVAPNDAKILAGLRDQGYTCKGEARCRRVKDNIEEIIEVGNGRAVFVVKATRGTSADLEAALSSVLDDYGSVLP